MKIATSQSSLQVLPLELPALSTQMFLTVIESGPESFGAFALDIQGCIVFSTSRDEAMELYKLAAESHLRGLATAGEPLPIPETLEIPGLTIGVQSGTITLEWTTVELTVTAQAQAKSA